MDEIFTSYCCNVLVTPFVKAGYALDERLDFALCIVLRQGKKVQWLDSLRTPLELLASYFPVFVYICLAIPFIRNMLL